MSCRMRVHGHEKTALLTDFSPNSKGYSWVYYSRIFCMAVVCVFGCIMSHGEKDRQNGQSLTVLCHTTTRSLCHDQEPWWATLRYTITETQAPERDPWLPDNYITCLWEDATTAYAWVFIRILLTKVCRSSSVRGTVTELLTIYWPLLRHISLRSTHYLTVKITGLYRHCHSLKKRRPHP